VKYWVKQPEQNERTLASQPEEVLGCEACLEKLSADLQEQLITSTGSLRDPFIRVGGVLLDFTDLYNWKFYPRRYM
jgi:hypothetical protein